MKLLNNVFSIMLVNKVNAGKNILVLDGLRDLAVLLLVIWQVNLIDLDFIPQQSNLKFNE